MNFLCKQSDLNKRHRNPIHITEYKHSLAMWRMQNVRLPLTVWMTEWMNEFIIKFFHFHSMTTVFITLFPFVLWICFNVISGFSSILMLCSVQCNEDINHFWFSIFSHNSSNIFQHGEIWHGPNWISFFFLAFCFILPPPNVVMTSWREKNWKINWYHILNCELLCAHRMLWHIIYNSFTSAHWSLLLSLSLPFSIVHFFIHLIHPRWYDKLSTFQNLCATMYVYIKLYCCWHDKLWLSYIQLLLLFLICSMALFLFLSLFLVFSLV